MGKLNKRGRFVEVIEQKNGKNRFAEFKLTIK